MLPLTVAGNGETGTIVRITGRDEVRQHLAELGFVVGTDVTVLNRVGGGMVLAVKDSRVALDRSMAGRISVEPRVARASGREKTSTSARETREVFGKIKC